MGGGISQPLDRARLSLILKPIIEKEAKEQQGERTYLLQKSVKSPIHTQEELAKIAGVSHDTIHKVEVVERETMSEQKDRHETILYLNSGRQ